MELARFCRQFKNDQTPDKNDQIPEIEIIVADSMQVYKGMDIGTAKPTPKDRKEVRHHCLDLVEPSEDFSAGRYQTAANSALKEIAEAKKAASRKFEDEARSSQAPYKAGIVVGGTGLYIRALIDNLQIPAQYPEVRKELEEEPDTQALWHRLNEMDPVAAKTMLPENRRRILRALEVSIGAGRPFSSFGAGMKAYEETDFCQVAIRLPREIIDRRIDERYEVQMEQGFLKEVKKLSKKSLSKTARQALGYKELLAHLEGKASLKEALDSARSRTKRFARRQERWFRRDPRIHWIEADSPPKAFTEILGCFQQCFNLKLDKKFKHEIQ